MRRFLSLLLCCFLILLGSAGAEDAMYIRVVGADNSPAAQATKLQVRDAVLRLCPDNPDALDAALPALLDAACQIAPCTLAVRDWTPEENMPALPTVYIVVGAGTGHNWWGVLYGDALKMTGEDIGTDEITFVWPLWDWFLSLFGQK